MFEFSSDIFFDFHLTFEFSFDLFVCLEFCDLVVLVLHLVALIRVAFRCWGLRYLLVCGDLGLERGLGGKI